MIAYGNTKTSVHMAGCRPPLMNAYGPPPKPFDSLKMTLYALLAMGIYYLTTRP